MDPFRNKPDPITALGQRSESGRDPLKALVQRSDDERQHLSGLLQTQNDTSTPSNMAQISKHFQWTWSGAHGRKYRWHIGKDGEWQCEWGDDKRIYGCNRCGNRLSNHDDIISRNFRGQHGKAYLFDRVSYLVEGERKERLMTTGKHVTRDVSCTKCAQVVGWKYDSAEEESEKYKEGKVVLEGELLVILD